ncbi:MAG: iron uptake transporter permease EfeU [Candidatus Phosphoribacter sp.]|nr:FTR1 family protein [Actinomycetales bacterium]
MFAAALLIGLREGLEASLIVGILLAYVTRRGRVDLRRKIGAGVGLAVVASMAIGATFTFTRARLDFTTQEVIGGSMSLLAVALVTWMVFWMLTMGRRMKAELESEAEVALASGAGWALFWIALVSVGREGIETMLMLWGWAMEPAALAGALTGIAIAIVLGYLIYRGLLRVNFATFFAWTGALLIIVAAGILAYGIHDLQEARVLPGPFSGHPVTPTDMRTGDVLTGVTDGPFWMAAYPFGWAFDLSSVVDPSGAVAAFLKGTVGFTPQMSWLQVTAWCFYLVIVFPRFLRRVRSSRSAAPSRLLIPPQQPATNPQPTAADRRSTAVS